jgi:hypothetical protein
LTYHAFDELKVIVMGNGDRVLGFGVLDTFLMGPAEYIKREQSCPGERTSAI